MSESKKYVLFSPIGNHDPFGYGENITEGPLLHIIRHYKPEIVVLFLTKEMTEKENTDKRYSFNIGKFFPDVKIEFAKSDYDVNDFAITDPQDFDGFMKSYNNIFKKIKEKYPEHEILFNVSSGTPQMISEIILEAQLSNIKTKAIQVTTPLKKANIKDRYTYDDYVGIDTEKEEVCNRCVEPNFNSFKKMKLKSQVITLIKNYEYNSALNLIQNEGEQLFSDDLINLLKHSHYRSVYDLKNAKKYEKNDIKLNKNLFEYFYTIKLKQLKGELDDMVLKITPFVAKILRDEVEKYYKLSDIITMKKGEKREIEQIERETLEEKDPELLKFLDEKFQGYKTGFVNSQILKGILEYKKENLKFESEQDGNKFNQINKLFNKFITLDTNIRNSVAHEMVCIDEDIIKQCYNGKSKDIIKDLETLLKQTNGFSGRFVYDELNKKLIELL